MLESEGLSVEQLGVFFFFFFSRVHLLGSWGQRQSSKMFSCFLGSSLPLSLYELHPFTRFPCIQISSPTWTFNPERKRKKTEGLDSPRAKARGELLKLVMVPISRWFQFS